MGLGWGGSSTGEGSEEGPRGSQPSPGEPPGALQCPRPQSRACLCTTHLPARGHLSALPDFTGCWEPAWQPVWLGVARGRQMASCGFRWRTPRVGRQDQQSLVVVAVTPAWVPPPPLALGAHTSRSCLDLPEGACSSTTPACSPASLTGGGACRVGTRALGGRLSRMKQTASVEGAAFTGRPASAGGQGLPPQRAKSAYSF